MLRFSRCRRGMVFQTGETGKGNGRCHRIGFLDVSVWVGYTVYWAGIHGEDVSSVVPSSQRKILERSQCSGC